MSYSGGGYQPAHLQYPHRTNASPFDKSSTTAAYGVLIIIFIYYVLQYLPLSELLWNTLVWITPSPLISRLDSGFASAMVEEPEDDTAGYNSKGQTNKSNAMRRIFGFGGAGLLNTVQRTRTLSNLGSVFKATPKNSLPGLGNWDNSCYQNSVLQGLAALESLTDFLNQNATSNKSQPTKTALKDTIAKLNDPRNVGKIFWTPAELKSMCSWQQQDAQEYFSKVSDELEKDIAQELKRGAGQAGLKALYQERSDDIASKTTSDISQLPAELKSLIARNPLEGLLAQRVGCQQCGYVEGLSLVPFNCLTVPLGRLWMYDVRSCLDDYTALEPIKGVECAKCTLVRAKQQMGQLLSQLQSSTSGPEEASEDASRALRESLLARLELVSQALEDEDFSDQMLKKCQIPAKNRVSTIKSRQAVIARPPKSLVIHINRSNFDELTGVQSKNLATVRFPQQLDLAPWCLGQGLGLENKGDAVENWNVDPSKSMLSDDEDLEGLGSGKRYELRAVITHYGRHENGHYICYRKAPYAIKKNEEDVDEDSDSWWRLSDDEVTQVDEDIVLAQGGVFMLFYEQVASVISPEEGPPKDSEQSEEQLNAIAADEASGIMATDEAIKILASDTDSSKQSIPEEQTTRAAYPTPPMSPSPSKFDTREDAVDASDISQSITTAEIAELIYSAAPHLPAETPQDPTPTTSETILAPPNFPSHSSPVPKARSPKPHDAVNKPAEHTPPIPSPKDHQPVSPASMRTAAPRSGRGSVGRAGKAMGSVAGFVQAN
ncbi:hypothetical protein N7G274_000114 [Stereocaulon virgatum]|uniref:ubiquitinyl hydrolase 1 n=1 Tax=Stereocaulon virgatum TaxID=373712 RepID=A0ABR4AXL1_9LECA